MNKPQAMAIGKPFIVNLLFSSRKLGSSFEHRWVTRHQSVKSTVFTTRSRVSLTSTPKWSPTDVICICNVSADQISTDKRRALLPLWTDYPITEPRSCLTNEPAPPLKIGLSAVRFVSSRPGKRAVIVAA